MNPNYKIVVEYEGTDNLPCRSPVFDILSGYLPLQNKVSNQTMVSIQCSFLVFEDHKEEKLTYVPSNKCKIYFIEENESGFGVGDIHNNQN